MIQYCKMSLFNAPRGSILVHACNCKGVWGRGIAAEFKALFPNAFHVYNHYCVSQLNPLGTALLAKDTDFTVGCLMTSYGFGLETDPPGLILENTRLALESFFSKLHGDVDVYSNKFNSGLFRIPWELTEKLLKNQLEKHLNVKWTVCDPNL